MTKAPQEWLVEAFSHFVEAHVGLHFSHDRWPELLRGARGAIAEMGFADFEQGLHDLMRGPVTPTRRGLLARHLTVGETYFFRDPSVFAAVQECILPALIESRLGGERRLRLWSAGCSTGEEAYTLAMVVRRVLPDTGGWRITILGTDINPHALRKAEEGIYAEWSFRNVPDGIKQCFFRKRPGGTYEIAPDLKRMVAFSSLNLVEDVYPALLNDTNAMDVVFCRNVLMYFTPVLAQSVVRKLCPALVDGGWLALGAGDVFGVEHPELAVVEAGGVPFFRKRDVDEARAAAGPAGRRQRHGVADRPAGGGRRRAPLKDAESDYGAGRYRDAAARLSALTRSERASPAVFRLLAQALANEGKLSEALTWCERETRINPSDTECLYLKATVLLELGDAAAAAKTLRQSLHSNPGFVPAHIALGNLERHEGRRGPAHWHYAEARRLLSACRRDALVPGADGMTAGRLSETVAQLIEMERTA
jgi:chemotaxis protein methyltransferase CheR